MTQMRQEEPPGSRLPDAMGENRTCQEIERVHAALASLAVVDDESDSESDELVADVDTPAPIVF